MFCDKTLRFFNLKHKRANTLYGGIEQQKVGGKAKNTPQGDTRAVFLIIAQMFLGGNAAKYWKPDLYSADDIDKELCCTCAHNHMWL